MHLEKRNDVLIEPRIVPKLFDEVEKDVRSEGLQFLAHKIDIVVNGKMLGRVTGRTERGHDIRLSLPVLRFHLLSEILVERRGTCAVKKYEHFEFLFHVIWCA